MEIRPVKTDVSRALPIIAGVVMMASAVTPVRAQEQPQAASVTSPGRARAWNAAVAAVSPYGQVRERPIPGDPVRIDSGLVSGKLLASGVRAYFGVPFAMPPVRELRWREPQPAPPWTGVLDADRPAPECMQTLRAHDINHYFGEESTSEDCLYLNVWAPPDATNGAHRPVIVWIYGGGFTIGSANMANYGGETLARKGVVYISIAYRVGAFGFLAHPALTAESPHHSSGNVGFLDQIAALQWIQRNVAAIGGDPGNVTVMGQSAGSMSVSILQASPLASGLFQHVVGMSGSAVANDAVAGPRSLAAAERDGERLQEDLHAADLTAMRNLPADRILFASVMGRPGMGQLHYGAVIDGSVLPASPLEIFTAGKQNDVPTLIGFVHDESFSELGRVFTLIDFQDRARKLYGEKAEELLKLYPARDDAQAARAARDAGRDSSVALEMRTWARAQTATGKSPVYAYVFSRVHPYAPGVAFSDHDPKTVGAYHTGDVPYWLGTLDALNMFRVTRNWTDADRALSESMSDAIVAFATTGNPNRAGSSDWPVYRAGHEQIRELDLQSRIVSWPDSAKMDFFVRNSPVDRTAPPPPATGRSRD
ncbi:MAG: para-nitrobenzyl esterase [Gammaproteobacteria bacterium]|nr:para-nitrobenzyl esterase [Gammaproteobacteria bacterium]